MAPEKEVFGKLGYVYFGVICPAKDVYILRRGWGGGTQNLHFPGAYWEGGTTPMYIGFYFSKVWGIW